jgi:DNA repair protein RadC
MRCASNTQRRNFDHVTIHFGYESKLRGDVDESISIQDMPGNERPRERLLQYGAAALSNAELLAIILRTGTAQENVLRLAERLLARYQGLQGIAQASPEELQEVSGLGSAKATQILAALEIGKRAITYQAQDRPVIKSAADAAQLVIDMGNLRQEQVRIILLDNGRRVIAIPTVYMGTLNTSVLRVSEIFREAITRNSPAVILAHNHPSGDPAPSPEDVELTRTLVAAGKLLDIQVIDHLIIGQTRWVSLKEMRLGFG